MEEIVENTEKETEGMKSKKVSGKKATLSFKNHISNLSYGGGTLLFVILATFVVVAVACMAVFFATVQGEEKVMVPNVVGKPLTTALFEMQDKELYPEIVMNYSDLPGEAGTILAQNPKAGAIVKAYRRITLTVSRGVATTRISNYTGMNVDTVKTAIETEYAGERPLITVMKPSFQKSKEPYGSIISQYPEADYPISDPVDLYFVVSAGDFNITTSVPDIKGKTIEQVLKEFDSYNVVFDFTAHEAEAKETANSITSVTMPKDKAVALYSRIPAEIATTRTNKLVSGVYSITLDEYPYNVAMRLEATDSEGKTSVLTKFTHSGKSLTIPYEVKPDTTLRLYVLDELIDEKFVN